MSRLTELIDIDGMEVKVSKERPLSKQGLGAILHKLYALEDLEEQLYNVPLEFILKHEHKQVYWDNAYHDVRNIVPYEEHTEPYVEIFVRLNNKVVVKTLFFKNYGKTWWLIGEKKHEED